MYCENTTYTRAYHRGERMSEEIEEVIMKCKCGRTTHMKRREFESLIAMGRLEGFLCDTCDRPMIRVVFDPLSEV